MNPLPHTFPGRRWLPPLAAALLVLGLFGWMARCSETYARRSNPADHNYNLLVRGFQSGQLSLKLAVPAGLAQLADPLNPKANAMFRSPPYWLHDLSYYRGRLFLYFGVTPALLLFWPWAAVTGHYLFHQGAVAVFCAITFLAGAGLLLGLWRRYFPEIGAGVAAAGLLALGLATGMPVLLQRAEFYEVAVSCGSALCLLALAGIGLAVEQPARRGMWLGAASLACGLAVGARPSVLFGAAMVGVPVAMAWREARGDGAQRVGKLWAAAVLPLALCGLGLMLYNQRRFGSPFEFGERYQLAGDRQDVAPHFSASYLWFNFRVYFLAPARWSRSFPFVQDIAPPPLPPGHAAVDGAFGVLANLPVLLLALAAPLAWRGRSPRERAALRATVFSVALLFIACALPVSLFYGSCWRYEAEFLPALGLLAVIGLFGLERALAGRRRLRIGFRAAWSLLLACSISFDLLESVYCHGWEIEESALDLSAAGRKPEAAARFAEALALIPTLPGAHNDLGITLVAMPGRLQDAIGEFETAVRLEPDAAEAYYNLGNALAKLPGRLNDAIADYETAVRLNPDYVEAHCNLGLALAKVPGRMPEAVAEYQAALRLNPDYYEAHNNLGIAWAGMPGRLNDAIGEFAEAVRLDPESAASRKNLAEALEQSGGGAPSRTQAANP